MTPQSPANEAPSHAVADTPAAPASNGANSRANISAHASSWNVTSERLAGKRVLICEDEGLVQAQLSRALTLAGLEVVGKAANGRDAVEMALRERPDIVLMDLNVPVIDGMEAARRILVEYTPCVVIVSAYGDGDFRRRAEEIGCSGYITKPVTAEALLPQIEAALEVCVSPF